MGRLGVKQKFVKILLMVMAVVIVSGCAKTVHNVPHDPITGYPDTEKIPLNIGVVKTPSLQAAKWDDSMRMAEFGTALLINTETMANTLFQSAVTVEGAETNPELDGYLIPEVTFVDSTHGMAFQDIITTLIVEWTFADSGGETIWLETVEGQGITKAGGGFGPGNYKVKFTERARIALNDLFKKSYKAISTSAEIRRYSTR